MSRTCIQTNGPADARPAGLTTRHNEIDNCNTVLVNLNLLILQNIYIFRAIFLLRAPPTIDPSPLHIQKVHPAKPYDDRTREELIYEIELVKGKTE